MPKVEGSKANIPADRAFEAFRDAFGQRYDVYELPWYRGRDFMVRATSTVGVSVAASPGPSGPVFAFDGTLPSDGLNAIVRGMFGLIIAISLPTFGLLAVILIPIYRGLLPTSQWQAINDEITAFLEGRSYCPHTSLKPRWDNSEDEGKADKTAGFTCDVCGAELTLEEGQLLKWGAPAAARLAR